MKRSFYLIIPILLLLDLGFSFYQHYNTTLDGDMPAIVLPSEGYSHVLKDPFGISVLLEAAVYPAPNRFFAHWTLAEYFRKTPIALQQFLDPIESIYAASALFKTLTQLLIILLLAAYISGSTKIYARKFLLAALIITPLFQTSGYNTYMGIIDKSIAYTSAYAFPLGILMLFYFPFFRAYYLKEPLKLNFLKIVILLSLAIVLAFNGPLIPGVVLIICPMVLVYLWWLNFQKSPENPFLLRCFHSIRQISTGLLLTFIFISILSLYSLYIGKSNAENLGPTLPLADRYMRLPFGIYNIVTVKLGMPLLLIVIIINYIIIKKVGSDKNYQKFKRLLLCISIFSIIYILLLPLGGYRSYRPDILRRDTILPVILCLFFLFGASSFHLIHHLKRGIYRTIYVGTLSSVLLIFTIADEPIFSENLCEKMALQEISQSSEKEVVLENDCSIMSWGKISKPEDSKIGAQLLYLWGVTKEEKKYFQK